MNTTWFQVMAFLIAHNYISNYIHLRQCDCTNLFEYLSVVPIQKIYQYSTEQTYFSNAIITFLSATMNLSGRVVKLKKSTHLITLFFNYEHF